MTESRSFEICLGSLCDDPSLQLKKQGINLNERDARVIDRAAESIDYLFVQCLLSEAEKDRARKRLMKEIRKIVTKSTPGPAKPKPPAKPRFKKVNALLNQVL